MATEDNFIVAIELGSSKVTGMAGRKQPDGAIQVLAFAQEPSTTFIRKGRINNVSKMTQCIISMKDKLEQKMQRSISRVYVGIGGMGMHTVANTVVRHFDSKVEITQEMVDAMCDENRSSANSDRDILESVPQEYHLGTQVQNDPVGILSDNIEGHYLNIVANSSVREEIRNCFRAAGITIADLPINVLAMADTVLTEPEKRSGCVLVDMGAETTSVAVYKNNLLRHMAVIPLGGANINRDIQSLQIEDDEAEQLKLKYGSAVSTDEADSHKPITTSDGRQIPYEEFMGLVEARVEEIILNVKNQISLSNYDVNQLIGGLIVTGGASHMRGIDQAFTRDTKFEKIRFVHNIRIPLRATDYPGLNDGGDCNAVIALIDKGEINCCGGPLGQPSLFEEKEEQHHEEPALTAEEEAAAEAQRNGAEEQPENARKQPLVQRLSSQGSDDRDAEDGQHAILKRRKLQREFPQRRRKEQQRQRADDAADHGSDRADADGFHAAPLLGQLVSVDRRRGGSRRAGRVAQRGSDRTAVNGRRVDGRQHDQSGDGRHSVGDGNQQRHAHGSAEAGQRADDDAAYGADDQPRQRPPLEGHIENLFYQFHEIAS